MVSYLREGRLFLINNKHANLLIYISCSRMRCTFVQPKYSEIVDFEQHLSFKLCGISFVIRFYTPFQVLVILKSPTAGIYRKSRPAHDLIEKIAGLLLGDKGYIKPNGTDLSLKAP